MSAVDRSAEDVAEQIPRQLAAAQPDASKRAPHIDWTPPPAPAPTRRAVLFYATRPPDVLPQAVQTLRQAGVHVTLVGPPVKGYQPLTAYADVEIRVKHRAAPIVVDPTRRPRRYTPRWAVVVATNLCRRHLFRYADKVVGKTTTLSWALLGDRRVLAAVDAADVLTSLDASVVYSVWQAARRNRHAAAISGIRPTLEHLGLVG
jgi:hypothetical protein